MTSNIKELDPVQGLVDYIEDIKPYHTKVIEILTEYVYNEAIDTTITDYLHLRVDLIYPGEFDAQETFDILCGFGAQPYDGFTAWPVIPPNITLGGGPFVDPPLGYDPIAGTIIIPGDRTGQYIVGSDIEVDLYAFDTVLDTRTVGVQTQYTIADVVFDYFGQTNGVADTPHTTITVVGLADPAGVLPPLGVNEVYAAGVNLTGTTVDSVVGYSNAAPVFYTDVPPGADPLPTPTVGSLSQNPDENPGAQIFSNSFVFIGDVESFFSQGFKFQIVGGSHDGNWTVKYAYYDSISGNTYVRVIEHIDTTIPFVAGDANERFFGYDNVCVDQSNIPVGLTSTEFVEGLTFSWYDDYDGTDVIDGCQFQIKDAIIGAGPFVPHSLTGAIGNDVQEAEIYAFEVTTAGTFWIAGVIGSESATAGNGGDDSIIRLFDQSGTQIGSDEDQLGDGGTEVFGSNGSGTGYPVLAAGIYQIVIEQWDDNEIGGHVNMTVAPLDGTGLDGGTGSAQHTGLRYVGKGTAQVDPPALVSLPALLPESESRHSMAAFMSAPSDDGHLFQFEVTTAGTLYVSAQSGAEWTDPVGGPNIEITIYDSAGAVFLATRDDWDSDYLEEFSLDTFPVGVYQVHVAKSVTGPDAGTNTPISVWVFDNNDYNTYGGGMDGSAEPTGIIDVIEYDRQLDRGSLPGVAGVIVGAAATGFTVNGDATDDIVNGQVVRINGSPTNDGTYTVSSAPTYDGQFTVIEVAESLNTTEMGGWLECTNVTPATGPDAGPPPPSGSPLTAWTTIQNIEDPALTGDGMFGQTVAISDDGMYIFGGPGDSAESVDTGGIQFDGAVISYQESAGPTYITPDHFSHTDAQNFPDFFGGDPLNFTDSKQIAVFGNGSRIAVGAYYYPQGGTESGAVYIFDLAGTYSQTERIDLGGVGNDEQFGFSITTSGDGTAGSIMVVGAPGAISGEGRVYVYENQAGTWTLIQTLAGGFGTDDQQFGTNVTMSRDGSTLAVGENWESGAAPATPFYEFFYNTYEWNGSTFDLIERFSPNPAGDIWNAGYMQAELSDDGTILAMSIGDNYVWVSTLSAGTWSTTNLTSLMPGLDRYSGLGMNGLGDLIFVGSNGETAGNGASGVVHVLKNDGGWVLQDTVDNPDATDVGYSEFGRAIEANISGDRVVIGNGYADGGFGGGGAIAILEGT